MTVVRVWEADPPADVEPLEWLLGTDLADQSADALVRYCGWYEWRWPTMEEYHEVQKTGLGIERLRFETKARLLAAIALLRVVAVRVLSLRWHRDARPDEPAESVASADELRVLAALQPTRPPPATVRLFVDAVAKLGGWPSWAGGWVARATARRGGGRSGGGTSGWPTWCSASNWPTRCRAGDDPNPHDVGNSQRAGKGRTPHT